MPRSACALILSRSERWASPLPPTPVQQFDRGVDDTELDDPESTPDSSCASMCTRGACDSCSQNARAHARGYIHTACDSYSERARARDASLRSNSYQDRGVGRASCCGHDTCGRAARSPRDPRGRAIQASHGTLRQAAPRTIVARNTKRSRGRRCCVGCVAHAGDGLVSTSQELGRG